jgi:hypothetical protein
MGNKGGKASKYRTAMWVVIVILGMVIAGGTGWYFSVNGDKTNLPNPLNEDNNKGTDALGQCFIAPTVTVSATDKALPGTAVTVGSQYLVNGVYKAGTPTLARGDEVQILANASSYIDAVSKKIKVDCGGNPLDVAISNYATPTLAIIKANGDTLTDSATGGAYNATAITAGGQDSYEVDLSDSSYNVAGDLIYVVELGNSANVSAITLSANSLGVKVEPAVIPSFYVDTLTSPAKKAFRISGIEGSAKKKFDLSVELKANKALSGAVYTTAYVVEGGAIDTNGKLITSDRLGDDGVTTYSVVEKQDGTTVYEATFDYDFYITP